MAAQLGYCGLDGQRRPLRGDEIRGCWEAAIVPDEGVSTPVRRTPPAAPEIVLDRTPVRRLEFVEVGSTSTLADHGRRTTGPRRRGAPLEPVIVTVAGGAGGPPGTLPAVDVAPAPNANQRGSGEPRWSLWGDADV